MDKSWLRLFYLAWLCTLALWPSSLKAECPVTATGLCTPGVEETIVIDEVETIEYEADGYTVITDTTTTTTTVTITNPDSGDILDGDAGYVSSSKYEGDMDLDWEDKDQHQCHLGIVATILAQINVHKKQVVVIQHQQWVYLVWAQHLSKL